jgi:hypothetical protein
MSDSVTTNLKQILAASGVTSVIWIDDQFDERARSLPDVVGWLAELHHAQILPVHPLLSSLTVGDEVGVWTDTVTGLENEPEFAELARSIEIQYAGMSHGETLGREEYTTSEFSAIQAELPALRCIGLSKWKADKPTLLASMSSDTLVIIDREFLTNGAAARVGDDILKELAHAEDVGAHLVMLTHSVGPAGAAGLRRDLAEGDVNRSHRFAVVSKAHSGDPVSRLKSSLHVVMTQGTCLTLLRTITEVMKRGADKALADFMGTSLYDLDAVVFEKSLEEGASEIDVLTRLVLLRQRVEVDGHLASDTHTHAKVASLRTLRSLVGGLPRDVTDSGFKQLRTAEVFDSSEVINRRHTPLSCGDMFRIEGQQKKLWILLGQPCDIAVRSNGTRKSNEAFLVLARPVEQSVAPKLKENMASALTALEVGDSSNVLKILNEIGEQAERLSKPVPAHRFYPLHATWDNIEWQLDFNEWSPVNLVCLDLCVFNADGKLVLDSADTETPIVLLPGWKRRLENARAAVQRSGAVAPADWILGGSKFSNRTAKLVAGVISFKCQRVGRIRAPRSVAAYASFSSTLSRAAFDHDFTDALPRQSATDSVGS